MPEIDLDIFRHALSTARARKMASVEVEIDGVEFEAVLEPRRSKAAATALLEAAPVTLIEPVKSSYVGYYGAPDPALEVGSIVKENDPIGVVSTLGISNEVLSPVSGEVVEILINDGGPVQFGQALIMVKVE